MGRAIVAATGCIVGALMIGGHPWEGVALILGWGLGILSVMLIDEYGD